ncbi:MAG TPA: alkaline phosphatase family protein [Allosphingosinicella sp.]|jgi:predicted AlkP superfamily pyrophosphatase or phosphodiesterase|uniref:alkaline phosphatase family protein n=1 Tax=Allosphingosinicella sp. TaxID=2823234 RepID=UPI002F2984B0
MNSFLAAIGAAFLIAAPASAQPAPAKPKLVVVISVDQLSSDLFAQYRQHFTGGLRRLSDGVVFPSGYQAHAATETCPGHSTILTGSRPSRTGVIANNWFNLGLPREDKQVYCAEDPRVPGSTSSNYTVSSYHLKVPALGDLMKRADPGARVAAVAGKDRAAVMMGGHGPDHLYWWSGKAFTGAARAPQAASLAATNRAVETALSRPRQPLSLPPVCQARSRAVPVQGGQAVGAGRFARDAGDSRAFRASPELDGASLAFAGALRSELRLGEGRSTDLLIVGVSATDYVGHTFGTQGAEMCLQLLSLDRDLGDFFALLDRTGIDYLVALTSDHGGLDLPERQGQSAAPGALRVDPALAATTMGKAIGARLGLGGPVLFGDGAFGDMYIDRALPPAQRARVLAEALRSYRTHPQVAAAFSAAELSRAPSPSGPPDAWSLLDRARASFDPERSGDLVVMLKPMVTPIADASRGYVATHGSPWDYDRRVPILFWRRGLTPYEQPLPVETVDIMPTLASILGVPIAAGSIDGRCLDLIEGPATSCR